MSNSNQTTIYSPSGEILYPKQNTDSSLGISQNIDASTKTINTEEIFSNKKYGENTGLSLGTSQNIDTSNMTINTDEILSNKKYDEFSINNNFESIGAILKTDQPKLNNSTTVIKTESYENTKYVYSYKELTNVVENLIEGKLKDFIDENEEKIKRINEDIASYKGTIDSKVDNFKITLDWLTSHKQFNKTTVISIVAIVIGAMFAIIPQMFDFVNSKLNNLENLRKNVSVLQEQVEDLKEDGENNEKDIEKIRETVNNIEKELVKITNK
jgi:predicted  nucleic acid-binding Zn-ribbon protein